MEDVDTIDAPSAKPPRTWKVLGLLAMTSLIFSYLGSYAMADVLVHAEVVPRWPPNTDPRPKWMLLGFSVLMVLFIAAGGFFRWLSGRQLRAIDAMDAE